VTTAQLAEDPHPVLRRLRAAEPVSWLPALGGWLVTRRDLAERVLRDPRSFTVDDPRFTTAQVVGPSMLSLDGPAHRRHREPFYRAFRAADADGRLAGFAAAEAARLVAEFASAGRAELRRDLAGPLAAAVMAEALKLAGTSPAKLLTWYDAIVAGVSALAEPSGPASAGTTAARLPHGHGGHARLPDAKDVPAEPPRRQAGYAQPPPAGPAPVLAAARAVAELRERIEQSIATRSSPLLAEISGLSTAEVVSNVAVLLFGGIETTEGMISNLALHLLADPVQLDQVAADRDLIPAAADESLRLEPAAAVVDRYAAADVRLGAASISHGDQVTVSLAGANRDPAVFPDPDRFDLRRPNARQHLAFVLGPHFCVGAQLAVLESRAAISALLDRLPGLRLDPAGSGMPRGLVFRKPTAVVACWTSSAASETAVRG
jgi:cytochrome P450